MAPLDIAREAAEELGMPMMAHIDYPPPTLEDVLDPPAPRRHPHPLLPAVPEQPACDGGRIRPEISAARERGVLFDIGHGMGSFSFEVARTMLAGGFMPDTISSDVHALCIDGPAFDLITTMSKFLCLGVPLAAVVKAATVNAAAALQRPGSRQPEARQRGRRLDPRRSRAARSTMSTSPTRSCAASRKSRPNMS